MSLKSVDRERAEYAFDRIKAFQKKHGQSDNENLKSYGKNVPAYVMQNGLVATMAFLESKLAKKNEKKGAYDGLYEMTQEWLYQKDLIGDNKAYVSGQLAALDSGGYKAAEKEVLALFTWVRRFVESSDGAGD